MLITEPYRMLNRALLATGWGNSASTYVDEVRALTKRFGEALDYGCGRGALARAGATVLEYDPCMPGKDRRPGAVDLVCCIDVLEHVEPECLDAVLADIAQLARKAAFFVISTQKAATLLPDGRNAHLTVQSATWWREKLLQHFRSLEDERDLMGAFQCIANR